MRLPNYFNNLNSVFFQSKNLDAKCNFSEVKKYAQYGDSISDT